MYLHITALCAICHFFEKSLRANVSFFNGEVFHHLTNHKLIYASQHFCAANTKRHPLFKLLHFPTTFIIGRFMNLRILHKPLFTLRAIPHRPLQAWRLRGVQVWRLGGL